MIPVIKADAYGHGAIEVADALSRAGARIVAVAILEEAVVLRDAGISQEILVLEGAWPGQEEDILRYYVTPAVHSAEGVRSLERAARKAGSTVNVQLKIDTGMTRLGVPWDQLDSILDELRQTNRIRITGTFSHLACAEEEDPRFTREQIRRFTQAISNIQSCGLDAGELHLANSAGLLFHPELRSQSARPGIALYGYSPDPSRSTVRLTPPLTLKSKICQIQTIPPGTSVGYNRLFVASRTTRAATLPIGYADGYRRALTGKGKAIVRDQTVSVLGSVNMDMIVIDVTEVPEVQQGEEVILLGSTPRCRVDASIWAELLGTSPYEILCGIGPRVPRVYTRAKKER